MLGCKILIVDNVPAMTDLIERICSPMGFECETAENGKIAIDTLSSKTFDLVITDMSMPEVDGMNLLVHVKKYYPSTDVICITGYSEKHDFVKVINAGACDFMGKPFKKKELEAKLNRIFRERTLLQNYQKEIQSHMSAQQELQRSYRTQEIINKLLLLILEDLSLNEILNEFIQLLTDLPWLDLEKKGAVFLSEGNPAQLVLKAHYKLAKPLLTKCKTVPFGKCLCGRAATSENIIFVDCIDDRHDITFKEMAPHGHYCVPIVAPDGKILGVYTLYTVEHAIRNNRFERIFYSCAKVLASIIIHKRMEEELVSAKDSAEEASRAKSSFLSTVSHELRTPMNGIIGATNLLKKTNLAPKQDNYIEMLEKSSERMMTLVSQVLDLSELNSSGSTLETSLMNATKLIDELVVKFQGKAKAKGLMLHTDIDSSIPEKLQGYTEAIFKILSCLLDNAIKYTNYGEIGLSVSRERVSSSSKVTLLFSIKDTGCGISHENQKTIFESFSQKEHYLTRTHEGAGIGLSLCEKLINKIGGEIEVESRENVGSTFSVIVPFTV